MIKNNNLHIFEYNCTYRQIKIEIDKDKIPEFLLSRVLGRPSFNQTNHTLQSLFPFAGVKPDVKRKRNLLDFITIPVQMYGLPHTGAIKVQDRHDI